MKNRKVTRILAAVLTGAMLMATPSVAMASPWYYGSTVDATVPSVQNLAVSYDRGDAYLSWTPIQLADSQTMFIEYSSSPEFPDTDETYSWEVGTPQKGKCFISSYMRSGLPNYYRAVILENGKLGAYSNVVSYTPELDKVVIEESRASKKQVYFKFKLDNKDDFTGVEIWRAEGNKKYQKVATTTDAEYTDKNLKSETTYRYRLRGYVLNQDTQEKNYGDYVYYTKTTWGSDLDVEAKAKNSKTAKLTWNKVKGATEYKIYRMVGSDSDNTWKDGDLTTESLQKWTLLKTVKANKNAYTDKKLKPELTYTYKVEAIKEIKSGSKVTDTLIVSDTDTITLGFDGFEQFRKIENPDGSIKATWKKSVGVEGYKVYMTQYLKDANGSTTDQVEVEVASLPATAKSYTFQPVADTTNWSSTYKIYAYSGNDYVMEDVTPEVITVDRVNNITATPNPALDGITVSWTPVPGAAYYRVYRSRYMSSYNADYDSYSYSYSYSGTALKVLKTPGTLSADGTYDEPKYTEKITGTSVVDTYLGYTVSNSDPARVVDIQDGPKQGIRYYYYVEAYAPNGKPINDAEWSDSGYDSSSRFSKPASAILNNVTANKPEIKKIKAEGKGKVEVTWKKSAGADKYIVYYSTKKKSGYTYGGITTGNKLTIKNLTPGKTYYFQVKGVEANAAGGDVYSSLSKAKSVKVR